MNIKRRRRKCLISFLKTNFLINCGEDNITAIVLNSTSHGMDCAPHHNKLRKEIEFQHLLFVVGHWLSEGGFNCNIFSRFWVGGEEGDDVRRRHSKKKFPPSPVLFYPHVRGESQRKETPFYFMISCVSPPPPNTYTQCVSTCVMHNKVLWCWASSRLNGSHWEGGRDGGVLQVTWGVMARPTSTRRKPYHPVNNPTICDHHQQVPSVVTFQFRPSSYWLMRLKSL